MGRGRLRRSGKDGVEAMARRPPSPPGDQAKRLGTRLTHAGRDRSLTGGAVNPQIQRASTVLVESAEQLYAPGAWTYGRHGTATHKALSQALSEIEDATHCALVPSGLLACTVPIFAFAEAGGHVLVTDNCYGPTRRFCDRSLKRWGAEDRVFRSGDRWRHQGAAPTEYKTGVS